MRMVHKKLKKFQEPHSVQKSQNQTKTRLECQTKKTTNLPKFNKKAKSLKDRATKEKQFQVVEDQKV